jgi:phage virion morphogenesis protein
MNVAPYLQGLLTALSSAERRKLARDIAADLRQRQQRRIAAQTNPDGTPYAPRKPRLRAKQGRIRRSIFARLRTTRYLRVDSTADAAMISITGRAARIARVHQYGLTDRVGKRGPEYRYPRRRILGIADADRDAIAERIIDHLS